MVHLLWFFKTWLWPFFFGHVHSWQIFTKKKKLTVVLASQKVCFKTKRTTLSFQAWLWDIFVRLIRIHSCAEFHVAKRNCLQGLRCVPVSIKSKRASHKMLMNVIARWRGRAGQDGRDIITRLKIHVGGWARSAWAAPSSSLRTRRMMRRRSDEDSLPAAQIRKLGGGARIFLIFFQAGNIIRSIKEEQMTLEFTAGGREDHWHRHDLTLDQKKQPLNSLPLAAASSTPCKVLSQLLTK